LEMTAGAQRRDATTLDDDIEQHGSFIVLFAAVLRAREKAGRNSTSREGKTRPRQLSIRMAAQWHYLEVVVLC
jgi:hypothetical protein